MTRLDSPLYYATLLLLYAARKDLDPYQFGVTWLIIYHPLDTRQTLLSDPPSPPFLSLISYARLSRLSIFRRRGMEKTKK